MNGARTSCLRKLRREKLQKLFLCLHFLESCRIYSQSHDSSCSCTLPGGWGKKRRGYIYEVMEKS